MNSYEEIYYTELSLNQFKVVTINVKEKSFKVETLKEEELDADAIIMSSNVLEALILGLSKVFKRQ